MTENELKDLKIKLAVEGLKKIATRSLPESPMTYGAIKEYYESVALETLQYLGVDVNGESTGNREKVDRNCRQRSGDHGAIIAH